MNRDKIMAELKQLDKKMFNLVKSDNLLSGLETSSLERIQQLIDAETGQKIRIFIVRDDGKRYSGLEGTNWYVCCVVLDVYKKYYDYTISFWMLYPMEYNL